MLGNAKRDAGRPDGTALKEWASAVEALIDGRQTLLMRKGGIAEETRDFMLAAPRFWLLPTYEHQREHLLKEASRPLVARTLAEREACGGNLVLKAWAEVVRDIEVSDMETLSRLDRFHIWTGEFADERLKWKRTKPLHVLILRVHRLEEPVVLPNRASYAGCKSWVTLEDPVPDGASRPVMEDEPFAQLAAEIAEAAGQAVR